MPASPLKLAALALREAVSRRTLPRSPEAETMSSADQVEAFDRAGERYLTGLHRFNAREISHLAPRGARIVDLGCGGAQFLAHLAEARPDLHIIGVDLSEPMIEAGRRHIERVGLAGRIELRLGDMAAFRAITPARAQVVTSVFSLHHLPDDARLRACLREIAASAADGGAVWIFDHARPKTQAAAALFPGVFTPHALAAFNQHSTSSLAAAFTYEELSAAMSDVGLEPHGAALSRVVPYYQIHWRAGAQGLLSEQDNWRGSALTRSQQADFKAFSNAFKDAPSRRAGR